MAEDKISTTVIALFIAQFVAVRFDLAWLTFICGIIAVAVIAIIIRNAIKIKKSGKRFSRSAIISGILDVLVCITIIGYSLLYLGVI